MSTVDLAVIAGFVVAYGLLSRKVEHSPLTGPMVFVAFGLIVGSAGFDILDLDIESAGVEVLAEATLGLLLFTDATRIDLTRLRNDVALPARMLVLGLPLAIAIGTGLGVVLFDVPIAVAALIAAILAPTDAALGEAVVTSEQVPVRVRQSLNVESGLNDGIALPAVAVFVALAAEDEDFSTASSWIRFAAEQVGFGLIMGLIVGCVGALAVRGASRRSWMEGIYRQLSVLGVAVLAFTLAAHVGGNGFIAMFVGGLAFGAIARIECASVAEFTDDLAHLLAMISFIVFGALVVGPSLDALTWSIAIYAIASLVVVRPLAIALSLIGSKVRMPTVLFFGWFGPRGLASILFGIVALEEAHGTDLDIVFVVMSWTVLLSIVAHGLSAGPAADAYGRWWSDRREDPMQETMVEAETTELTRRRGHRS
ncbi:MAG: NhaP-type Na+/H+ or K+/H+ antiporter [Candidatus Aldehydirespiratoraceae bacterium]|jgi:NhaP-type Na+/H+ or K+/H+ antiporter